MAATPDLQRQALRAKLVAARQALPDRLERAVALQNVLRVWLVSRGETSIGAYWPIKGEFDPLPALYRWSEASGDGDMRRIGLPVADRATGLLRFRVWYPGCEMELDAYDIPKLAGPADFVFMANAFHGVPDRSRLAQAVGSALKADGYFAIVNWHKRPREETPILGEPRGPKTELRMSPEETVKSVEGRGLKFAKIVEVPPYHYGAVFQRVGA